MILKSLIVLALAGSPNVQPKAVFAKEVQSETWVKAYIVHGSSLVEIKLVIVQSQNGYVLDRFYIDQPIYGTQDRGYGNGAKVLSLNPNNAMAVNYNFTHYVETTQGVAYFNIGNRY